MQFANDSSDLVERIIIEHSNDFSFCFANSYFNTSDRNDLSLHVNCICERLTKRKKSELAKVVYITKERICLITAVGISREVCLNCESKNRNEIVGETQDERKDFL